MLPSLRPATCGDVGDGWQGIDAHTGCRLCRLCLSATVATTASHHRIQAHPARAAGFFPSLTPTRWPGGHSDWTGLVSQIQLVAFSGSGHEMAFGSKRPMAGHVSTFEMWGGMPGDLQCLSRHRTSHIAPSPPDSLRCTQCTFAAGHRHRRPVSLRAHVEHSQRVQSIAGSRLQLRERWRWLSRDAPPPAPVLVPTLCSTVQHCSRNLILPSSVDTWHGVLSLGRIDGVEADPSRLSKRHLPPGGSCFNDTRHPCLLEAFGETTSFENQEYT